MKKFMITNNNGDVSVLMMHEDDGQNLEMFNINLQDLELAKTIEYELTSIVDMLNYQYDMLKYHWRKINRSK